MKESLVIISINERKIRDALGVCSVIPNVQLRLPGDLVAVLRPRAKYLMGVRERLEL